MDHEQIRFEVGDDHVATLTLDRPEAYNAFTEQMAAEVVRHVKRLARKRRSDARRGTGLRRRRLLDARPSLRVRREAIGSTQARPPRRPATPR